MDRLTKSIGLVLIASSLGLHGCSNEQDDDNRSGDFDTRSTGSGSHSYSGYRGSHVSGSHGAFVGGSYGGGGVGGGVSAGAGHAGGSVHGGFGGSAHGGGG